MVFFLFYSAAILIPLGIAIGWAATISSLNYGIISIITVLCGCLFITFFLIGLLQWYGTRWVEFNFVTVISFVIAALCVWTFTLVVSLVGRDFSYTSCSFTLLTVNYLPACWIVYLKTLNNDINLRMLIVEMTKL